MTKQGWVALHRAIQEHWLWKEKPFSKGQAWIDMLMMANHDDNKFLLGNELVEVKAGSFITSELKLAERWGWSKTKVRSFLNVLQNDSMIVKKSDRKKTTITIENYSVYSVYKTTEKPQKNHKKTTEKPQKNTNNNENNDNNENNINNKHGEFKNVVLSDEEIEKLKAKFPDWEERIEKLSAYMKSKGKKYKSHYATILSWARSETKGESKNAKVGNNPSTEKGLGTYI